MRIEQTSLQDCFIVHDRFFGDARGYFFESFNKRTFQQQTGIEISDKDKVLPRMKDILDNLNF